ncbi:MAG: hypothetical protein M4D80_25405 [Myxococcota bacterium]|nr:hypothetical protein [Myxococcota bacterium]
MDHRKSTAEVVPAEATAEPPHLVLRYPGNATFILLDARALDRIAATATGLMLGVSALDVELELTEGEQTARRCAELLAPSTRSISGDTSRRPPLLVIDDQPVLLVGDGLIVTGLEYAMDDVERSADEDGGVLYLMRDGAPIGAIQSALGLLAAVAASIDDNPA